MTDYKQRQSGVSTFRESKNVQIEQEQNNFYLKNIQKQTKILILIERIMSRIMHFIKRNLKPD
jgi:hypothetical protein